MFESVVDEIFFKLYYLHCCQDNAGTTMHVSRCKRVTDSILTRGSYLAVFYIVVFLYFAKDEESQEERKGSLEIYTMY
jgi:hypothetical protein